MQKWKANQHAIVFVLGIVFTQLLTGCLSYKEVTFQGMEGYEIVKMDKDGMEAELKVKVRNPNGYNIKVKGSNIDLYIDNDRLGKVKVMNTIKLKKKSTQVYKIRLKSKFDQVGGSMLTMGKSMFGGGMNVRTKGHVKASAFLISKKVPFDITERVNTNSYFSR